MIARGRFLGKKTSFVLEQLKEGAAEPRDHHPLTLAWFELLFSVFSGVVSQAQTAPMGEGTPTGEQAGSSQPSNTTWMWHLRPWVVVNTVLKEGLFQPLRGSLNSLEAADGQGRMMAEGIFLHGEALAAWASRNPRSS